MTQILHLQSRIQDTQAELARLERSLIERPTSETLRISLASLRKRLWDLEEDYVDEADKLGIEICRYRIFRDDHMPTVAAVSNVLGDFQRMVSTVYASLKYGPKERARLSRDVIADTEFAFGYSFAGSVGVVMTVPNDRLLLGETFLDEAMRTVFEMARAEQPATIARYAQKLGPSAVRLMYQWAKDHAAAGVGADIQWIRRNSVRGELLIERPEIASLADIIERTSAVIEEPVEVIGDLRGADLDAHSFHLKAGGRSIRGRFANAITPEVKAVLPQVYRAFLRRTERVVFALEKTEETFFLERLETVEPGDWPVSTGADDDATE